MKNLIYSILISLLIFSCKNEPKNYVEFSGKVENLENSTDSVMVFVPNGYEKRISIQKDGSFQDTLQIKEGKYRIKIGDEYGLIYLKNDDEIHLTTDYKNFDEKLKFTGNDKSSKLSNLLISHYLLINEYFSDDALELPQDEFDAQLEKYQSQYHQLKEDNKDVEAAFWKDLDDESKTAVEGIRQYYLSKKEVREKLTNQPSPSFAMLDVNDKMVKLEDFKGKYVYIDVWATWCGPCKREIPALKKLEAQYHDKNIAFVSMSIDEVKDKEKWKNFVADNEMTGVQIFAENAWESTFVQAYEIKGIPRFILVDPSGKIISPDAPRPSSPALVKLLEKVGV